jgi:hypothetical protein
MCQGCQGFVQLLAADYSKMLDEAQIVDTTVFSLQWAFLILKKSEDSPSRF